MHASATVAMCLGLASTVASCDSDFKLSDINTDITVGGSIAAPIGTTDTLTLSRIIDLTDKLQIDENGAYAITTSGNTHLTIDKVDCVEIKDLTTNPSVFAIDVPQIPGTVESLPISAPVDVTLSMDAVQSLPDEVDKLTSIGFDEVTTKGHIQLSAANLKKISGAKASNFKMVFPKLIEFASGISGLDYSTNTLTVNKKFNSDGSLVLSLPIVGLKDFPKVSNHQMHVQESITCKGDFECTATNITAADLQGLALSIYFEVPDVEVDDVYGTINAKVNMNPESVELGDIPDVLTDESTEINLNKVNIQFDVTNPVGVPFIAKAKLRALDKDGNYINEAVSAEIPVAAAGESAVTSHIFVTNSDQIEEEGYTKVLVPNLTRLIKKVPSTVEITANVDVDKSVEHHLVLGKEYQADIDYEAWLPFDLGAGSHIVYRDSVCDLSDDIQDFTDIVKDAEYEVDANIFSTIPFAVTVNLIPRDANGNTLTDVLDFTDRIDLDPGHEGDDAQKATITLREKEEGALNRLDRLDIVVEGDTNDAVSILKPTQYVVVGLVARLPKGVTIKD